MSVRAMCLLGSLVVLLGLTPPLHSEVPNADAVKEVQPPRVTIQERDIPLSKALRRFATDTGIPVEAPPGDDPKLKLDLKGVPFWQALDAIAREADMRVYPYLRDGKLGLLKGYRAVPTCYSGPFRVTLKRVVMVRDFEIDKHQGVASIEITWLPPFQAFLLETQPSGFVVRDDKGLDLELPHIGKGHTSVFGRNAVVLDVPLPAPRRTVPSLGLIKGSLSMIGAARMLKLPFDKIAKGKEATTKEGVAVKLSAVEAKKGAEQWQVQLHLFYPKNGPTFESFQMQSWLAGNRLYLVKGDQRFRIRGFNTDPSPADQALITYLINEGEDDVTKLGDPADWKLEYETPSPVLEVAIPFAFKDVELP